MDFVLWENKVPTTAGTEEISPSVRGHLREPVPAAAMLPPRDLAGAAALDSGATAGAIGDVSRQLGRAGPGPTEAAAVS